MNLSLLGNSYEWKESCTCKIFFTELSVRAFCSVWMQRCCQNGVSFVKWLLFLFLQRNYKSLVKFRIFWPVSFKFAWLTAGLLFPIIKINVYVIIYNHILMNTTFFIHLFSVGAGKGSLLQCKFKFHAVDCKNHIYTIIQLSFSSFMYFESTLKGL